MKIQPTLAAVIMGVIAVGGIAIAFASSIVGGGGGKVAEAYDGYAYQSRICQEYGRQPRRYQVREPIPGSDWRNDGGWAIVLERGTYIIPAYTYYARSAGTLILNVNIANTAVHYNYPVTVGDGRTAYVQNVANPTFAIIDRNGDRVINTSDAVSGNSYQTVAVTSGTAPESYAGSLYIRWANMAWCR